MLEITNKTIRYGQGIALDGVSLRIDDGERVAVVGPNGSGKTTLLKALAASGNLPAHTPPAVAVLPQTISDELPIAVHDFVMLGRTARLSAWHAPSPDDEAAVACALEAVDAAGFAGRRMDAVSGGERQRLMLAMALATEAPCLILDEPVAHLDFRRRDELFALLGRLGKTILMALHEIPFDTGFFTRVILMASGRIVADGNPERVLTDANLSAAYGIPASVVPCRTARSIIPHPPSARQDALHGVDT